MVQDKDDYVCQPCRGYSQGIILRTTENAVRIQIYVAICTYLLVTIVKNDMKLERSTYKVLQILSISLTDKTHLKDLFDKTKFQYDKDRFGPNGPNLFNV